MESVDGPAAEVQKMIGNAAVSTRAAVGGDDPAPEVRLGLRQATERARAHAAQWLAQRERMADAVADYEAFKGTEEAPVRAGGPQG